MADNLPDIVAVCDSKDQAGPALTFSRGEWSDFIDSAKNGTFDLW